MVMKLSVNGVPANPVELVNARLKSVDPNHAELFYLVGYLTQLHADAVDQALSSLEHHRQVMREREIMRKVDAA
jgi:hypothetical protein